MTKYKATKYKATKYKATKYKAKARKPKLRKLTIGNVLLACTCARAALRLVPKEDRPRLAIEAAEAWAKNPSAASNAERAERADRAERAERATVNKRLVKDT